MSSVGLSKAPGKTLTAEELYFKKKEKEEKEKSDKAPERGIGRPDPSQSGDDSEQGARFFYA
jgi:hypothetical protein